ncbi:MAG TPA: hypothetical protein VGN18_13790 [Jatrophihabitans sp.]|jgi:hypothetical protein|uniref:hypothetical protein n=1 Tax=Jatrophihabitans sp. TaxID=1932789 RepID=UPI002DF8E303|nr:hypothetical protein [Jatrophihabitans sp.]
MRRRGRWAVVAAITAALVAMPLVLRAWPVGASRIGARQLLARIVASGSVGYAGYAQSQGGLTLPVAAGDFSVIDDLFGGTSRLRVWWRSPHDWRVDSVGLTGESDTHEDAAGVWTWDYESNTARRTDYTGSSGITGTPNARPPVRLPRSDDLLPASLGRRLLSEADPGRTQRIPDARVAGYDAAGLRLHLDDARSTIDHIDVWALPSNGLPVRVVVYGDDGSQVVSTSYLDLSLGRPSAGATAFRPAPAAKVESGEFTDIVAAIDRFGRSTPPPSVAGMARRRDIDLGAVGVYGRGVDLLVAVPLSAHLAGEFVPQLRKTPGSVEDDNGIAIGVGPLNLQLSHPYGFGARWLLVGTLTAATLAAAVAELPEARGFGFD